MATIEQNNILCNSKIIFLTSQNEKVFLLFHYLFCKKPSSMKSRVLIQSFTRRQHRTKMHLLSELWALYRLTHVRTIPGLPYHTVQSTIQCRVPYSAQYHIMHSTIQCTIPYSAHYHTEYKFIQCYSTIQCRVPYGATLPYSTQYHTVHRIIQCAISYSAQYHIVHSIIQCTVPYSVTVPYSAQYHIVHSTIQYTASTIQCTVHTVHSTIQCYSIKGITAYDRI